MSVEVDDTDWRGALLNALGRKLAPFEACGMADIVQWVDDLRADNVRLHNEKCDALEKLWGNGAALDAMDRAIEAAASTSKYHSPNPSYTSCYRNGVKDAADAVRALRKRCTPQAKALED